MLKTQKKKINDFKSIIKSTKNYIVKHSTKIFDVHLLNLYRLVQLKNPYQKDEEKYFLRLYHSVNHLKDYMNEVKPIKLCNSLFDIIQEKVSEKMTERLVSEITLLEIQYEIEEQLERFDKRLHKYFSSFKDIYKLQKKEKCFHDKLAKTVEEQIQEEEKQGWNDWNRKNFIEKILNKIQKCILQLLIERIQIEFKKSFRKIEGKTIFHIGRSNYESIFNIDANSFDLNEKDAFNLHDQLKLALLKTATAQSLVCLAGQELGMLATSEAAIIPGIGWVVASLIVSSVIYSHKNQIGLFERKNCKDDIVKKMVESIYSRRTEIIENNIDHANKIYHNLVEKLRNAKIATAEIDEIKQKILDIKKKLIKKCKMQNLCQIYQIGDNHIWRKIKIEELDSVKNFENDFPTFEKTLKEEAYQEY